MLLPRKILEKQLKMILSESLKKEMGIWVKI